MPTSAQKCDGTAYGKCPTRVDSSMASARHPERRGTIIHRPRIRGISRLSLALQGLRVAVSMALPAHVHEISSSEVARPAIGSDPMRRRNCADGLADIPGLTNDRVHANGCRQVARFFRRSRLHVHLNPSQLSSWPTVGRMGGRLRLVTATDNQPADVVWKLTAAVTLD